MSAAVHPWTGATVTGMALAIYVIRPSRKPIDYTDVAFDSQYQYQGPQLLDHVARHLYSRKPEARRQLQQRPVIQSIQHSEYAEGLRVRWPMATTTGSCLAGSISIPGDRRTQLCMPPEQLPTDQTPHVIPNSNGYIAEIAYIPFITSSAPVLAMGQRARRISVHLLQQIRRHDAERTRQQHAVPPRMVCDVATGFQHRSAHRSYKWWVDFKVAAWLGTRERPATPGGVSLQLALQAAILTIVFATAGSRGGRRRLKHDLQAKMDYCKVCHGASGQGFVAYYPIPRLAGQQPSTSRIS